MTAQDLKNAVLQQAIQGKLLPQNPTDEPASELLKKISAERQKLIDEGKIKNPPQLSPISDDEKPFDIPENWQWVRLGEIVSVLGDGIHGTPEYDLEGKFYFINGNNLSNGKIFIKSDTKRVNQSEYEKYKKFLDDTSILVSINGTLGNVAFYENEKIILGKSACYFNLMGKISKHFIKILLSSKFFLSYANEKATGSTIKNVSLKAMKNFIVPLPPLAEQKRIVEKLEEILPLVERYGELEQRLTKLDKEFPDKLKKSLLQQAIQGKLTEQLTTDGDAKDLLEKIRAEKSKLFSEGKIKKEKPLPPIKAEEIPFDIPQNWQWVRLGDICTKLIDGDHNPPSGLSEETEYIMISSKNINDDKLISLNSVRFLDKKTFETEDKRTQAEKGDIFFTSVGSLGRSCIFNGSLKICFQRSVTVIKTKIYNKYLKYCFDSPHYQKIVVDESTGTAQKGFYLNKMEKSLIPLPPMDEQERIVERLEELLPLCDRLKEKFSLM